MGNFARFDAAGHKKTAEKKAPNADGMKSGMASAVTTPNNNEVEKKLQLAQSKSVKESATEKAKASQKRIREPFSDGNAAKRVATHQKPGRALCQALLKIPQGHQAPLCA